MSTLVLMRHGQASFGATRYDALSELGQVQARATGAWIQQQGIQPTLVVHGPRQRQTQSALLLLEEAGLPLDAEQHNQLDEFAEGEEIFDAAERYFGRSMHSPNERSQVDLMRDYDSACRAWSLGELKIQGRLSIDEFREEVGEWFAQVTQQPRSSGQHIVAVTSAGVIAALVCEVLDLPNEKWHSFLRVIRNASLTEFLFSKGKSSLLTFNAVGHLSDTLRSSM